MDARGGCSCRRLLMSTTTTLAWWGISTWVPPFVASLASANGLPTERWASLAGMSYNVGAVCGYIGFGFCADAWGRRPATLVWFVLAWALTPVLFLWTSRPALVLVACAVNGSFSLGQYTWCPVWLPEAFPTRIRATAVSFCFNAPRFIAFVGPLVAGTLITAFGNYGRAAIIVSTIYLVGIVAAPFFRRRAAGHCPTNGGASTDAAASSRAAFHHSENPIHPIERISGIRFGAIVNAGESFVCACCHWLSARSYWSGAHTTH
jgi:MFS family permease